MTNPFFRNIEFIKSKASTYFSQLGFILLGFEGADADLIYGGCGWFQIVRKGSPSVVYTVKVRKQGNELKWLYDRAINPESAASQITHSV